MCGSPRWWTVRHAAGHWLWLSLEAVVQEISALNLLGRLAVEHCEVDGKRLNAPQQRALSTHRWGIQASCGHSSGAHHTEPGSQ